MIHSASASLQRITGFLKCYALYKSTFYLLTLTYLLTIRNASYASYIFPVSQLILSRDVGRSRYSDDIHACVNAL